MVAYHNVEIYSQYCKSGNKNGGEGRHLVFLCYLFYDWICSTKEMWKLCTSNSNFQAIMRSFAFCDLMQMQLDVQVINDPVSILATVNVLFCLH